MKEEDFKKVMAEEYRITKQLIVVLIVLVILIQLFKK